MLSCPPKGEHCDRHPRFLAGLRVDCSCANDHHQLCVVCIRHLRDQVDDSSNKPCPITLCRQLIAHCGGSADIKKKLDELIEKFQADKTMTKMDPELPLPHELTTEIFRFMDSIDMPSFLQLSRVIHTHFLSNARKNGWDTDSEDFGFLWHGGRDMAVNINGNVMKRTCVIALRPFGCICDQQQTCNKQQINYFEVKIDRLVVNKPINRVLVGLSWPGVVDGTLFFSHVIRSNGSFSTGSSPLITGSVVPDARFSTGDVIGCGMITMIHRKSTWQQIFFTKNGEDYGKTEMFSPFLTDRLYPMICLEGYGTQVTANFDGNPEAKPFLYDLSKISSSDDLQAQAPEQRKGRKRKAAD